MKKDFICGIEGNPASFCIALNTTHGKCDKFGLKLKSKQNYGRDNKIYTYVPCKKRV